MAAAHPKYRPRPRRSVLQLPDDWPGEASERTACRHLGPDPGRCRGRAAARSRDEQGPPAWPGSLLGCHGLPSRRGGPPSSTRGSSRVSCTRASEAFSTGNKPEQASRSRQTGRLEANPAEPVLCRVAPPTPERQPAHVLGWKAQGPTPARHSVDEQRTRLGDGARMDGAASRAEGPPLNESVIHRQLRGRAPCAASTDVVKRGVRPD